MKNKSNYIILAAVVLAIVTAALYMFTDYEKGGVWEVKLLDPASVNWNDTNPVRLRTSVDDYNAVTITITSFTDKVVDCDLVEGVVSGFPDIKVTAQMRESDIAKLNIGDTITVASNRFTYLCVSNKDGKHVIIVGGSEDFTIGIVSYYTARIIDVA